MKNFEKYYKKKKSLESKIEKLKIEINKISVEHSKKLCVKFYNDLYMYNEKVKTDSNYKKLIEDFFKNYITGDANFTYERFIYNIRVDDNDVSFRFKNYVYEQWYDEWKASKNKKKEK